MHIVEVEKQLQGNSTPQLSHKKSHGTSSIMGTSLESNGKLFYLNVCNILKIQKFFQKQLHKLNVTYLHLVDQWLKEALCNYGAQQINVEKQHQPHQNVPGNFVLF